MSESARTITAEQRERLAELMADVRSLNAISDRLTKLAEDITEDWEMNGNTFDACNNAETSVDDLLTRLGIAIEPPEAAPSSPESGHGA